MNPNASGTINLFVELTPCISCGGVISQFKAKNPNITVNIIDNNGIRLAPRSNKNNQGVKMCEICSYKEIRIHFLMIVKMALNC